MIDTRNLLRHSLANLAEKRASEPSRPHDAGRSPTRRVAERLTEARRSRARLLVEQLLGRGPALDDLIEQQVGAAAFHR